MSEVIDVEVDDGQDAAPTAVERQASRRRSSVCQQCKAVGVHQVAHRVKANGDGICNPHFRGELIPEEVKAQAKQKAAQKAGAVVDRSGVNGARKSFVRDGDHCVVQPEELHKCKYADHPVHKGLCREGRIAKAKAGKLPQLDETAPKKRRKKYIRRAAPAPSRSGARPGMAMIAVSESHLDAWWRERSVQEKAEAFSAWLPKGA